MNSEERFVNTLMAETVVTGNIFHWKDLGLNKSLDMGYMVSGVTEESRIAIFRYPVIKSIYFVAFDQYFDTGSIDVSIEVPPGHTNNPNDRRPLIIMKVEKAK